MKAWVRIWYASFYYFLVITGKNTIAFTVAKPVKTTGNIYQISPVISTVNTFPTDNPHNSYWLFVPVILEMCTQSKTVDITGQKYNSAGGRQFLTWRYMFFTVWQSVCGSLSTVVHA